MVIAINCFAIDNQTINAIIIRAHSIQLNYNLKI